MQRISMAPPCHNAWKLSRHRPMVDLSKSRIVVQSGRSLQPALGDLTLQMFAFEGGAGFSMVGRIGNSFEFYEEHQINETRYCILSERSCWVAGPHIPFADCLHRGYAFYFDLSKRSDQRTHLISTSISILRPRVIGRISGLKSPFFFVYLLNHLSSTFHRISSLTCPHPPTNIITHFTIKNGLFAPTRATPCGRHRGGSCQIRRDAR